MDTENAHQGKKQQQLQNFQYTEINKLTGREYSNNNKNTALINTKFFFFFGKSIFLEDTY